MLQYFMVNEAKMSALVLSTFIIIHYEPKEFLLMSVEDGAGQSITTILTILTHSVGSFMKVILYIYTYNMVVF